MNTRLQQFLAAENITQAQLADSLNVARAGVSHILAGRNKPSYDFLKALMLHYPGLNVEWLMFGKGKMYRDSSTEQQAASTSHKAETETDLLFTDEDLEEDIVEEVNIQATNEIKTLSESVKTIVKQRNVKKILILFDDGTYQEM